MENIDKPKVKFTKYGAPWCGPCRLMKPLIDQLHSEYPDVEFVDIDVDDAANAESVSKNNIKGIPALYITVNDAIVWKNVGTVNKDLIVQQLAIAKRVAEGLHETYLEYQKTKSQS